MRKNAREYFDTLKGLFDRVAATGEEGKPYQFDEAVDMAVAMIMERAASGGKLIFIGNGASAAISSHMAADFSKNAAIRAISFNDSSLLTCVGNDYGYEHVFEKPLEIFAEPKDVLVAISSSGRSENILLGVKAARARGLEVITFSGFDKDNPLRKLGRLNFYVPIAHYGYVETTHQAICHCLVDMIIENRLEEVEKEEEKTRE